MTTYRSTSDPLRRRPPAHALGWVRAAVGAGSRIVSVRPLPSSWLANHAITVADRHDYYHWLVLRRWARPGWDLEDPTTPPSGPLGVVMIIAPWPCASWATHRLRRWSALGNDPVRSGSGRADRVWVGERDAVAAQRKGGEAPSYLLPAEVADLLSVSPTDGVPLGQAHAAVL